MLEVQRLQNSYCQLLHPFDDMEESKLASESKLTHLSTWVLFNQNPHDYELLKPIAGADSLPMELKARFEG